MRRGNLLGLGVGWVRMKIYGVRVAEAEDYEGWDVSVSINLMYEM